MQVMTVNMFTRNGKELVEGCTYKQITSKSGNFYYNAKIKSISNDSKHVIDIEADNGKAQISFNNIVDWTI